MASPGRGEGVKAKLDAGEGVSVSADMENGKVQVGTAVRLIGGVG